MLSSQSGLGREFALQRTSVTPWGDTGDEPNLESVVLSASLIDNRHRRPRVVQISPRAGQLTGNISLIVAGGPFVDFGI